MNRLAGRMACLIDCALGGWLLASFMASPTAEDSHAEAPGVSVDASVSKQVAASEPSPHSKPCTLCGKRRDVLVRCQIDDTGKWHFLCVGKCWQQVSGGKIDGDEDHKMYRYGGGLPRLTRTDREVFTAGKIPPDDDTLLARSGMWKNKHEAVSAKKKKKKNSKKTSEVNSKSERSVGREQEGAEISGSEDGGSCSIGDASELAAR